MSELKQIEKIAKLMKKHKIEELDGFGVHIKLNALAFIEKPRPVNINPEDIQRVQEDDLYFSATAVRTRQ